MRALDHNGAPDFSTLQAALSDGKTDDLIFFAFDLLFADGMDIRGLPLAERKAQLKKLLEARPKSKASVIRYVGHCETGGHPVLQPASKLLPRDARSTEHAAADRPGRAHA